LPFRPKQRLGRFPRSGNLLAIVAAMMMLLLGLII
jgi:hypothetical protein